MQQKIAHRGASWTIGRLAQRAGCSVETVRHYERIGLLAEPERGKNGYRRYGGEDLRRLAFIRRSRELGFSQAQIRDLLSVVTQPDLDCRQLRQIILDHLEQVRMKLCELQQLEATLSVAAAQCELASEAAADCRFLEGLYAPEMMPLSVPARDCSRPEAPAEEGRRRPRRIRPCPARDGR